MSEISDPFDGFSVAYEAGAARLFAQIERTCRRSDEWPRQVRDAIDSVLALFAADPRLASLLLFEPYAAGRYAQLRHEETLARLTELLLPGRERAASPLPEALELGLVGSFAFVVGGRLRAGEPESLPDLAPELTVLILTPYLGREEAERIAAGGWG